MVTDSPSSTCGGSIDRLTVGPVRSGGSTSNVAERVPTLPSVSSAVTTAVCSPSVVGTNVPTPPTNATGEPLTSSVVVATPSSSNTSTAIVTVLPTSMKSFGSISMRIRGKGISLIKSLFPPGGSGIPSSTSRSKSASTSPSATAKLRPSSTGSSLVASLKFPDPSPNQTRFCPAVARKTSRCLSSLTSPSRTAMG